MTVLPPREPAQSEDARAPWLRRPAASDRVLAGDVRVSTAAFLAPSPTGQAPEYRSLAAPAIGELASRLAVPLFVGRPDPSLNPPPVDLPAVNGR